MNLSGGAVAQALAKAAGPALQDECTKKAPIAAGEIAVTGPGKILRCKCIIHINCPGYDQSGGQAETVSHTYILCRPIIIMLRHPLLCYTGAEKNNKQVYERM